MSEFITNDLIEDEVFGHKFKFKEMKGVEMDAIADSSISVVDGKMTVSIAKQREGWLGTIVETDFPQWVDLKSKEERVNFLNSLKSPIRIGMIEKVKSFHENLGEAIKK